LRNIDAQSPGPRHVNQFAAKTALSDRRCYYPHIGNLRRISRSQSGIIVICQVIDDEELDRVGDKESIAPKAVASAQGRAVEIGWMKGRSRRFENADAARAQVLSIAFHDRCNLIVAVATFAPGNQEAVEPAVIAFLNSDRVLRWVKWLTL
jgi:hypothetical protein